MAFQLLGRVRAMEILVRRKDNKKKAAERSRPRFLVWVAVVASLSSALALYVGRRPVGRLADRLRESMLTNSYFSVQEIKGGGGGEGGGGGGGAMGREGDRGYGGNEPGDEHLEGRSGNHREENRKASLGQTSPGATGTAPSGRDRGGGARGQRNRGDGKALLCRC